MGDGEGSSTFRYDSMGRLSTLIRTTAGATLTGNYGYNLAGGLQSAAYPGISDGPAGALTIYFGYDNAGRQTSSWWNNGALYQQMVSSYGFSHGSAGATETTGFGNGLTETVSYNNRLQAVARVIPGILDLGYTYNRPGDGKNNGNIHRIDDNITPTWDQSFTYDALGRALNSTGPGNIQLTFSYDRWGNKSQTSTVGGPSKPLLFGSTTNRIATSGYGYDLAGNMTSEPADSWTGRPSAAYQYDGAGRVKSATVGAAASNYYYYDGDGNRVRKVSGGQTRLYFYDPLGLSWERTTVWETFNLNFQGRRVFSNTAAMTPSKVWMHGDALGTPRVKTNELGAVIPNTRTVFFPFGEQYNLTSDSIKYKFTGKERDPETGLDWFETRAYGGPQGRFSSPDERLIDQSPGDPQSWNLYAYVRNNPLSRADPDGRACVLQSGQWVNDARGGQSCEDVEDADKNGIEPGVTVTEYTPKLPRVAGALPVVYHRGGLVVNVLGWATVGFVAVAGAVGIVETLIGADGITTLNLGARSTSSFGPNSVGAGQRLWQTLQTGGNTIRRSTAEALNEAHGLNLHSREWGRALEALKNFRGLSPSFHQTKILESGNVVNSLTGETIGNLLEFLP